MRSLLRTTSPLRSAGLIGLCLGAIAVVAWPSGVVAEGCYCAPIPEDAGLEEPGALETSAIPMSAILMTEGGMSRARPAPGERPTDVLWCASPDDPRCSPRDGQGSQMLRIFGHRAFGSLGSAPTISAFGVDVSFSPNLGISGPRGVRARVDRPPRA